MLDLPQTSKRSTSGARTRGLLMEGAAVVAIALAVLAISSHMRSTQMNNYVRLAFAILHGHLWIDYPGAWFDAVAYKGRHYGVDAPFPALLCLPFVAIWGQQANQTLVAIGVSLLGLFLAWRLLLRLGVARVPRLLLTFFFFAGTDYWWCAQLGDVWFLAHLCCVTLTFAILLELAGRRRGWLIALLAVAGIESRNTLLLAMPCIVYAMQTGLFARAAATLRGHDPGALAEVGSRRTALIQFANIFALAFVGWVTLNELMWGTFVDIGHTLYYHQDPYGHKTGSPFSLAYVPYQFYSFFIRAPEFAEWLQVAQYPYLKVNPSGVALTFTSPALVLACLARAPRNLVRWLWLTAALVSVPDFLYYLNGWYQFGNRHALDFEPFLLVLMAIACRTAMPRFGVALVVWSAMVGTWGVWWWNVFMRTHD